MVMLTGGNFIKTADVHAGEFVKFLDEGQWVENKKYTYPDGNPKQDFVITVEFRGEKRSMRLNKTNRDIVMGVYGPDTAKWLGKSALLTKQKALVSGKMQDMIILEIPASSENIQSENSEGNLPF